MTNGQDTHELRGSERNALLRDLGTADYAWLANHLEEVSLGAGALLVRENTPPSHVYFPQTGIVSLVALFSDGSSVEVGTIGCEGMVGLPVFLQTESTPHRTMVQVDATLRRLPIEIFEDALQALPELDRILRRFTDAYLFQVSQTAACNRMHDLGQRAARWLLMTHDRVRADTFALTHEFLAMMLGVRRAGVSEAAAELQRRGAIRYSRGRVTITDRGVLEQASCECYAAVRARFDSMLHGSAHGAAHVAAS